MAPSACKEDKKYCTKIQSTNGRYGTLWSEVAPYEEFTVDTGINTISMTKTFDYNHLSDYSNLYRVYLNQILKDCNTFAAEVSPQTLSQAFIKIKKVIFVPGSKRTIVIFEDNEKVIVTAAKGDRYDKEKGVLVAIMRKILGKKSFDKYFDDIFNKSETAKKKEKK